MKTKWIPYGYDCTAGQEPLKCWKCENCGFILEKNGYDEPDYECSECKWFINKRTDS